MTHLGGDRFAILWVALLASVLAGACGGMGVKNGSPAPCTSGALLDISLASSVGAMVLPTVSVCRNIVCYTSAFPPVPAIPDRGTIQAMSDVAAITGTLWRNSDSSITLDIEWRIDDESQLADGDHYVVTIADGAGVATTVLDTTATYARSAPGAVDSGPVCLQATLKSPSL
jgi:hypothetical protein